MKALVYRGPGRIEVEDVPEPELRGAGDAVVRVTTAGICGSDLHLLHGQLRGVVAGTVVGHEFTGVVEEVGSGVTGVGPGDRVVGPAAVWCATCRPCRANLPALCENAAIFGCGPHFGDLAGAQAQYVRVPYAGHTLQRLPERLTDEQTILAGDILLTAFTALEGITPGGPGVRPGDTVVIFGAGPVGLCAVAAARLFGPARVIAVDLEDYRLAVATRLGADRVVNPSREEVRDVVRELTGGWGADFVVEAVGSPETLAAGVRVAAPGGTVSVVGLFQRPVELVMARLLHKNLSLKTGLGHLGHMRRLLDLIDAGKLDLTPLLTHTLPLDQGPRGYERFERKEDNAVKVLLKPW